MALKLDRIRNIAAQSDVDSQTAATSSVTELPTFPGYPECVAIHVPPEIAAKYRAQAAARNIPTEAVLAERLAKHVDLTDARPIIFKDEQRAALEKLCGVFDVTKPHLILVYERHMRETDQIADAPTIELLEDVVRRKRRHVAWGVEVLDRLCDTDAKRERRRVRATALRERIAACGGVTGEG